LQDEAPAPLAEVLVCVSSFPEREIFFTFCIDTKFLDFKKNVPEFASNARTLDDNILSLSLSFSVLLLTLITRFFFFLLNTSSSRRARI